MFYNLSSYAVCFNLIFRGRNLAIITRLCWLCSPLSLILADTILLQFLSLSEKSSNVTLSDALIWLQWVNRWMCSSAIIKSFTKRFFYRCLAVSHPVRASIIRKHDIIFEAFPVQYCTRWDTFALPSTKYL